MQSETANQANAARAAWLRVLALAHSDALDAAYSRLQEANALPGYRLLRKPESGMAMVRARAGGTGAQFNLGEMSVTRCAVVLDEAPGEAATAGVSYVQGRGQRHAEQAAVLDALLQRPAWHQRVQDIVVAPLAQALTERAAHQAATAAQTRVEFFTMARGED
ncbi:MULTISPECIES: phosphonate C-P lyase system protein PhnG [unclassified Cupriavidus]|uniref:phosphonate C-P lyase system protein PhnG n=1 Tax=unclassified Cupriavidus TaxID=2640874 RepID=UPI001C004719|nr:MULTISPECIES: phosphonate C-P lyase system protein PhnG [unclassified Cupriavidus]MCA3186295.1 phosphonate C-P lyase system protein PhnG [Cupriavidus sp.]MCA3193075.1 phosphonate C-P lyase system protein PhnG [Cupriavidus sp.]MCA3195927.1 phosphonate C-P lyase system protein PhnG [Cupriavidus sp.]MCA3204828.1 phosphonate C-P lyase system protein PhnG [Cupriavidus sp.]MCA3206981.1 phosphonate C-P lyase system protein PhnG [Cupriavidus sp.]